MGRSRSSCSTGRSGDPHHLSTGRQALPERAPADTIARVNPRATAIGIALSLGACAPVAVPMPIQPFPDVPVPAEWTPYSDDWVMIRSPKITAARLIYFTPESVEETLAHARRLLARAGWIETRSDRFVSAEKFPGVWVEFSKDDDVCRLTVIAGAGATHVDYTLARVNPGS
jgi:hypothetical protein